MTEIIQTEVDILRDLLKENCKTADGLIQRALNLKNRDIYKKEVKERQIQKTKEKQNAVPLNTDTLYNEQFQHITDENRELYELLDEHERCLGLIMGCYRSHIDTLRHQHIEEIAKLKDTVQSYDAQREEDKKKCESFQLKIKEMRDIMMMAARMDQKKEEEETKLVTSLTNENQRLRELLGISQGKKKMSLYKVYLRKIHFKPQGETLQNLEGLLGYRGRAKNVFKLARNRLEKALQYAYISRRLRKRDFRKLWIERVGAGTREYGMSYNEFMCGLAQMNVNVNRKMLSFLAIHEPASFKSMVQLVRTHFEEQKKGLGVALLAHKRPPHVITSISINAGKF